jgi:hypothetical protein
MLRLVYAADDQLGGVLPAGVLLVLSDERGAPPLGHVTLDFALADAIPVLGVSASFLATDVTRGDQVSGGIVPRPAAEVT